MSPHDLLNRYTELQQYVGWTDEDSKRVGSLAPIVEPRLAELVDDFYAEIERHPDARQVITGGSEQIQRLKGTLIQWLRELLSGCYDADYVVRRWKVGYRHVEIGLDQVYTNVALSRLRTGLIRALTEVWQQESAQPLPMATELLATIGSLHKLLDLDLAIIEDAYQSEYLHRQQQAERLATIGQVAGGIAHELRNPLNVIKTSVYFLLNARNPSPEKVAEHLARIEKQVGLADGVITALSNFAKLPLPIRKPFAVEPWIRETLELSPLPASISITAECPASLPPALADVDQMRIVLGNLIRNAGDAMPNGGQLTVLARDCHGHIEVSVSDSGHGIAPEHLHRIMEPLFTTKARGIGLGLAMARSIVEKHDGHLGVASEPGRGATFTIHLPSSHEE